MPNQLLAYQDLIDIFVRTFSEPGNSRNRMSAVGALNCNLGPGNPGLIRNRPDEGRPGDVDPGRPGFLTGVILSDACVESSLAQPDVWKSQDQSRLAL